MEKLIEEIQKAEAEAIEKQIKINTIVLNEKYDYCKEFYAMITHNGGFFYPGGNVTYKQFPPMILGKKILIGKLPKEYDCVFLKQDNILSKDEYISKLEKENAELRDKLNKIKETLDYDI